MATMSLDELVKQLQAAYGNDLRSVVLYGSAAAGEHIAKRSDYNVLVLVDTLDLDRLRAASAVAKAWAEGGNPPPLTMTTAEWRSSADVFPMEYADILERNRVLHGAPPFDGLTVDRNDLRLQVEHETMGKLLRLRQGVLATGGDQKEQIQLLEKSLSAIMVVFRAVVRLRGAVPATDNVALTQTVAGYAGFDAAPFERVVRHVRGEKRLRTDEVGEILAGYLSGMQQLDAWLDRFTPAA